jgi:hypothetical protein
MKNNIKSWVCTAATIAACATTAYATPTSAIQYSIDGGTTWVLAATDNAAGDISGIAGVIVTTISAGGFVLTVVATDTYPDIGTLASPVMDLGLSSSKAIGAGSIIVEFSATGFTPVPGGTFNTTIAPNNGSGVTETETTRISDSDTLFGTGTSFAPLGPITGGFLTGHGSAPAGFAAPYSITISDTLTSTGGSRDHPISVSVDDRLGVPDGGNTLMLLGSALSVLGFGVFRKSRKA